MTDTQKKYNYDMAKIMSMGAAVISIVIGTAKICFYLSSISIAIQEIRDDVKSQHEKIDRIEKVVFKVR